MNEPAFRVSYVLTEKAYVNANLRLFWLAWRWTLAISTIALLAGMTVFIIAKNIWSELLIANLPVVAIIIGAASGIVVLFLLKFTFLPKKLRAIYREQKSLGEIVNISLLDHEFTIESKTSNVRLSWGDVLKWDRSSSDLLIFVNRTMFLLVPLTSLGEAATTFAVGRLKVSGLSEPRRKRRT